MNGQLQEDRTNLPNILRLKPQHLEIIRLHWLLFSHEEIAKICSCTTQTVSNTINSDLGREELSRLRLCADDQTKLLKQRIADVQPKALKILVDDMSDHEVPASVRSSNAKFILGELGDLTIKEDKNTPNHLTPAQMVVVKQLALQNKRKAQELELESIEETQYVSVDS